MNGITTQEDHLNATGKKVADEMLKRWKSAAIEPFADLYITGTPYASTCIAALVHRGKTPSVERPAYLVDVSEGAGLYWGDAKVDFRITFATGVRYPLPGARQTTYRYYAFEELSQAYNDVFAVLTTGNLESITKPFVL